MGTPKYVTAAQVLPQAWGNTGASPNSTLKSKTLGFLCGKQEEGLIKVEYHMFEENTYCTGAAFVPKEGGAEEDDGWIITFLHHEDTNISQAYIIDTENFSSEAVAKTTLPCRVPDGFHGAFMPIQLQKRITKMTCEYRTIPSYISRH
ncbi:hypothetical protein QUC31_020617 [Theobroma cacao]